MLKIRTFNSLRNPVYRLYYGGMLGQMAAMNMQMIVRSLLVYRLTGSATILGVIALAHAMPMVVFSLLGGVIADRTHKKYIILGGQLCSAIVALMVAFALTFGYLSSERAGSWWILIAAGLIQGVIMGIMMPSRQAIIAEIVGTDMLLNAVALNTLGMNVLRFLAPAAAGILIDLSGFKAVYFTMSGLYLTTAIFIVFIPVTDNISIRHNSTLRDLKDGIKYVRNEPIILILLFFSLIFVVLSRPFQFLLPIFTDDILKIGATGLGLLLSVSGLGAMFGSTLLASLPNKKRGLMFILSGLIMSLALICFAFSNSWILSLFIIVFIGVGDTGRMTLSNTLIQYHVEDQYRGRVMSILLMQFGFMSLGAFFAGIAADAIGIQWSIAGLAILLIFISLIMLCFSPRLRKLD